MTLNHPLGIQQKDCEDLCEESEVLGEGTRFKPKTLRWMSDKELNFSELNVEVFMDYSTVEESRERHKKSFVPVQLNHLAL